MNIYPYSPQTKGKICLLLVLILFLSLLFPVSAKAADNYWTPVLSGGETCCTQVKTFAANPQNGNEIYVGVAQDGSNNGIYKSTDSGQNLRKLATGLPQNLNVSSIAIGPNTPSTIFVGSPAGVFLSSDAGATWQDVTHNLFAQVGNPSVRDIPGLAVSPDYQNDHKAFLTVNYGKVGATIFRTTDGANSWQALSPGFTLDFAFDIAISPDYTHDKTVFVASEGTILRSTSGGQSWQKLNVPVEGNIAISPDFAKDHTLFVGGLGVFKSVDGGNNWTGGAIEEGKGHYVTISPQYGSNLAVFVAVGDKGVYRSFGGTAPWTPINSGLSNFASTQISFDTNYRLILNITANGLWTYTASNLNLPTTAVQAPASNRNVTYFSETHHTLAFGFKNFWEGSGGLAIFGFPQTEEFNEVNPDTGKVYTVQYFERQRYEYHPENQGTPYEVLLGRLGVTEAQQRNLLGTTPFQPANVKNDPNCRYFPETKHQTCNSFLFYWLSHGLEFGDTGTSYREALALFGLPISEEFTQDGRTVQYFERAVFEFHPENNGTAYEVLLRRLGAEVLTQRGWL